jgi:hypothetical protein
MRSRCYIKGAVSKVGFTSTLEQIEGGAPDVIDISN